MNHNRYIMTLLSLYETTIRTPAMYVASVMPHYQVILRHRSTLNNSSLYRFASLESPLLSLLEL